MKHQRFPFPVHLVLGMALAACASDSGADQEAPPSCTSDACLDASVEASSADSAVQDTTADWTQKDAVGASDAAPDAASDAGAVGDATVDTPLDTEGDATLDAPLDTEGDAGTDTAQDATGNAEDAAPPLNDWQDAVMYFAFVDRFGNGDPANDGTPVSNVAPAANYQGGDYAGIVAKIVSGYFNDLGVNTLWLTSPVDNPDVSGVRSSDGHLGSGYHGYWPQNLTQTESRFGTMSELRALVDAAHANGIRIVFDYVMNHVHASSSVYATHPDWFWPKDLGGQSCVCGSSACPPTGATLTRCWLADYLPDFNFTLDVPRRYSIDNVVWWMQQTGADGLRLASANYVEDTWHTDLRARVASDLEPVKGRHVYLLGDTYSADKNALQHLIGASMLDGQLDYPLRAQLVASMLVRGTPMSALASFLDSNDGFYGPLALMSTLVGDANAPRAIHFAEDAPPWTDPWALGNDRAWSNQPGLPAGLSAFDRLANAFTLLFTTRGVPLIYYGDEVGMPGGGDPDNRRMMQWSGYSAGQQRLLAHMKRLGQLRATLPALRRGVRTTLSSTAETFAYRMSTGTENVYIAINRSDSAQPVSGLPASAMTDQLTGTDVTGPDVTVPARSSLILVAP